MPTRRWRTRRSSAPRSAGMRSISQPSTASCSPGATAHEACAVTSRSELLQGTVVEAFGRGMPVAAICHGALLAARSTDPATGRSVLYGRKTTCLTWSLERRAWHVARIARFWDPDYYRTYKEQPGQPAGYMSVQAEVTRALAANDDFQDVSPDDPEAGRKTSGRYRDTLEDERPAFVVQDGSYLSARWPGDVRTFAKRFAAILRSEEEKPRIASPSGRRRD
jgi:hypothetical protein